MPPRAGEQAAGLQHSETQGVPVMMNSRKCKQLIKTTLSDAHGCRKDKLFHWQGWQKDKHCASPANKKWDFKFCACNSVKIIMALINWDHASTDTKFSLAECYLTRWASQSLHHPWCQEASDNSLLIHRQSLSAPLTAAEGLANTLSQW